MFEVKDANGEVVYRSDNFITISEKKEIKAIQAKEVTLNQRGIENTQQMILRDENGNRLAYQIGKLDSNIHFKTDNHYKYVEGNYEFAGHFEKRS